MRQVKFLEELRQMRFEESYSGYRSGRLSQEEAAKILGVCSRTFRRYMKRFESEGEAGLKAFFQAVAKDTDQLRSHLADAGLLRIFDLDLDNKVARHFPTLGRI